jgi:hypothetical protein
MGSGYGKQNHVMKTTLDIEDTLLQRAKQAALDRHTTLRAIVEEALLRSLGPTTETDVPVRTLVFPLTLTLPQGGPRLAADAIDAAIDEQRSDPADSPLALSRRMGATGGTGRRR